MKSSLFWSNILFGSSDCFHDNFLGAEAEICYFDGWYGFAKNILSFEKNILWFKISMCDSMIV